MKRSLILTGLFVVSGGGVFRCRSALSAPSAPSAPLAPFAPFAAFRVV